MGVQPPDKVKGREMMYKSRGWIHHLISLNDENNSFLSTQIPRATIVGKYQILLACSDHQPTLTTFLTAAKCIHENLGGHPREVLSLRGGELGGMRATGWMEYNESNQDYAKNRCRLNLDCREMFNLRVERKLDFSGDGMLMYDGETEEEVMKLQGCFG